MSDGAVFFCLLLIGLALSGWFGFCIGEDYGWRTCAKAYRRLMESA